MVEDGATLLEAVEAVEVFNEAEEVIDVTEAATDAEEELAGLVAAEVALVERQETALGTVTGGFAVKQMSWAYCTAVA